MPTDRVSKACLRCRHKKRRCNGLHPCRQCFNLGQECIYDTATRKKSSSRRRKLVRKDDSIEDLPSPLKNIEESSASLNSGDSLAKRLGLSTDSSSGQSRLCSWNFRPNKSPSCLNVTSSNMFSEVLTSQHMHRLAEVYFEEIQPVYKFLDPELVHRAISVSSTQPPQHPSNCVLLGIAALACLFRKESIKIESEIIHHARISLEYSTTLDIPTMDHVVGWLLRVIYLRFTSSPNATWLASCTLMHMIGAVELHSSKKSLDEYCTPQLTSQIYYTSQIFHTWISYDYGQPVIKLRYNSCPNLSDASGWTADDRTFWKLSESLDPNLHLSSADLENMLDQTSQLRPSHPAMRLKRSNIALCIYRRLRETGRAISGQAVDQVLRLADDGIHVATTMAKAHSPWWHVVNVPFQALCVLLAIDTPSSLARIGSTFQTLKLLTDEYGAEAIRETWTSACTLLQLRMSRKREDYALLNDVENDIMAYNSTGAFSIDPSLTDQIHDGPDDLGGFWELDEIFSTNLFTL